MVTLSTTIRRYTEIDTSYHAMMDIHTVMAAAQVTIVFCAVERAWSIWKYVDFGNSDNTGIFRQYESSKDMTPFRSIKIYFF